MIRRVPLLLILIVACQAAKTSPSSDAGTLLTTDAGHVEPPPSFVEPMMPASVPFDVAGDFTVPTLDGDWNFKAHFTSDDSYIFIRQHTGSTYASQLWNTDLGLLLGASVPNVHYFYLSDDATAADEVGVLAGRLQAYFDRQEGAQDAWKDRVHFINVPTGQLTGWMPTYISAQGQLAFAIDREQRVREVGLLGSPLQSTFVATAIYLVNQEKAFNFEFDRDQQLAQEKNVTIVPVLAPLPHTDGTASSPSVVDVALPDMSAFDTLEYDLTSGCTGNVDMNCPDWDQIGALTICSETPQEKCGDGTKDDGEDCDNGAANGTSGNTCSRFCEDTSKPLHVCNSGIEIARWITSYKRIGRWVTDGSPFLGAMSSGGTRRFQYNSGGGSMATLKLRLRKTGTGPLPKSTQSLWSGGGFNETYNSQHLPITFTPPSGTTKVQVVAFITGHGWGQDSKNCAEFCNTTHEIAVNGHPAHSKDAPMAGSSDGCQKQIDQGSVPNQYGTWPLGRDGWCPGLDVKPWIVDVTNEVNLSGSNTITYRGLFNGADYTPMPASNPNSSGFGAQINMSSYLVFSR